MAPALVSVIDEVIARLGGELYLYIQHGDATAVRLTTFARRQSERALPAPAIQHDQRGWLASGRAWIETGLIVIGLLAQFFLLPHVLDADGKIRYQTLDALLRESALLDNRYSLIGPLFATPVWLVGSVFGDAAWWVARFNTLFLGLGLLALYLLLRKRMDRGLLREFLLLLLVASMVPAHIEGFYGEVFTTLCVAVGVILLFTRARWSGWVALIIGVANTPAAILGLAFMMAQRALRSRRLRYLLIPLGALALIGLEAWIRRGSPFASGYGDDHGYRTFMPYSGLPGFSYPFFLGLLSLLFSFGKGIIFFAPGLLLPARRALGAYSVRLWMIHRLWLLFVVGLILVYASWWAWYGGWFWGPRFLLFASIPASLALAVWLRKKDASLWMRLAALGVLTLSCWVGLNGAVFSDATLAPTCLWDNFAREAYCHYIPEFSVLWRPFVIASQLGLGQAFYTAERLDPGKLIYAGFTALVYLYFAAPLVVTMIRQATPLAWRFARERLSLAAWRL